jgi:hypothetical protein
VPNQNHQIILIIPHINVEHEKALQYLIKNLGEIYGGTLFFEYTKCMINNITSHILVVE